MTLAEVYVCGVCCMMLYLVLTRVLVSREWQAHPGISAVTLLLVGVAWLPVIFLAVVCTSLLGEKRFR